MSYRAVANIFSKSEVDTSEIKLLMTINCKLDLDTNNVHPGDTVRGNLTVTHFKPFDAPGFLVVIDGTIQAAVPDENKSSRTITDSMTNLHIFTYVVGNGRKHVRFLPGTHVYPFAIRVPLTTLPGSFTNQCGSITYKVKAILDGGSSIFKTMATNTILMRAYFNLTLLKSIKDLWRASRFRKLLASKVLRGPNGAECMQISNQLLKPKKLAFVLNLGKLTYMPGDNIEFDLKFENLNGDYVDKIVVLLVLHTTFKVWSYKFVRVILSSVDKVDIGRSALVDWKDKILVPDGIEVASSIARANELINFLYSIRVEIWKKGEAVLAGDGPIAIGTTKLSKTDTETEQRQQIKLSLNLERYPIGWSDMCYPEDWDLMYKTGRIGYCKNMTSETIQEELSDFDNSDCVSIFSAVSISTVKSKPPNYSALSSRRASLASSMTTLPPTYEESKLLKQGSTSDGKSQ